MKGIVYLMAIVGLVVASSSCKKKDTTNCTNQLTAVADSVGNVSTKYTYDSNGNRVKMEFSGIIQYQFYNGSNLDSSATVLFNGMLLSAQASIYNQDGKVSAYRSYSSGVSGYVQFHNVIVGGKVVKSYSLDTNNDTTSYITYEYMGNDISKFESFGRDSTGMHISYSYTYTYDDKNNPHYSNSNEVHHNPITYNTHHYGTNEINTYEYSYTYNANGYPSTSKVESFVSNKPGLSTDQSTKNTSTNVTRNVRHI